RRTRWGRKPFRACRLALHLRGRGQLGMRPAGRMRRRRRRGVWRAYGSSQARRTVGANCVPVEIGVLCAVEHTAHESWDAHIRLWDLQIHKRAVLLAAEDVVIVDVPGNG